MEKGELAQNEQVHLFPQCFYKVFIFKLLKLVYLEERFKFVLHHWLHAVTSTQIEYICTQNINVNVTKHSNTSLIW